MGNFKETVELVGKAVDAGGVGVIALGALFLTLRFGFNVHRKSHEDAYKRYRQSLGRAILLGLELLVAGDIIRTVAVGRRSRPSACWAIVAIRTFLSWSLEVELTGRWPWRTGNGGSQAAPNEPAS